MEEEVTPWTSLLVVGICTAVVGVTALAVCFSIFIKNWRGK